MSRLLSRILATFLAMVKRLFRQQTPITLPHPEEPANNSQTVSNTALPSVLQGWFDGWQVPVEHRAFWVEAIDVRVYDTWPAEMLAGGLGGNTPAASWEADGKRHLAILAAWLNPGVIAHEQAHNSYALLTEAAKAAFSSEYNRLKSTDPYIQLLYSINTYGLSSDVEGHAEVYRYLGEKMPEILKRYYPKLF